MTTLCIFANNQIDNACREKEWNGFSKANCGIQFPASVEGFNFTPLSDTEVFSIVSHANQG